MAGEVTDKITIVDSEKKTEDRYSHLPVAHRNGFRAVDLQKRSVAYKFA